MDATTLWAVIVAFFAAAFLKGITGLGFSTICLGMVASFVDLKLAIPLMLVPSVTSNVLVMLDAGRFREALQRFWPLYLALLPGLGLGLWLLATIDSGVARSILGVVLMAYGSWTLLTREVVLSERWQRLAMVPVGLLTGVVNGITGSQVMPVLPYLLSLGLDKNLFVQAINIAFTLSSFIMLLGLYKIGLMSWDILGTSAFGVIPVFIGIWLGGHIRRRISDTQFRRLVLILLIVLGANLTF